MKIQNSQENDIVNTSNSSQILQRCKYWTSAVGRLKDKTWKIQDFFYFK